jgi:hypothetical protein
MKIKSILKNPWVVGLGLIIIGSFVDKIGDFQVLSWMWKQIKFFFTFSFPIKLWFFVLIVLLLVSVTLFLFFSFKEIKSLLNKILPKEPEQKIPDYVEEYTEETFEDVLYKWTWVESTNLKFPYTPYQIESFCPKCNCKLIDSFAGDYCSVCHQKYNVLRNDELIIKIRRIVENKESKE